MQGRIFFGGEGHFPFFCIFDSGALMLIPVHVFAIVGEQAPKPASRPLDKKYDVTFVEHSSDASATCHINAIDRTEQYRNPFNLNLDHPVSISLRTTKNDELFIDFLYHYPECENDPDRQSHLVVSVTRGDGTLRGDMMEERLIEGEFLPAGAPVQISSDKISSEKLAPRLLSTFIELNEQELATRSICGWFRMSTRDQRASANRKILRALRSALSPVEFDSLMSVLPIQVSSNQRLESRRAGRNP
jgi:hypothetical protein